MKTDPFILFLLAVVGMAYFFPEPARLLPLDSLASAGISLVFFFYGLKLSPADIRSGLSNGKLHLVIQGFTFIVFPLLVLAVKPFFPSREMWLGLFFLAALPSTVSSSVVMTSLAGGNVPAAIFNASISGLIGIFITPLWMSLFIRSAGGDVTGIYLKLLYEIVLPIAAGLLLQKWLGAPVRRYSFVFTQFDRSVILLVIYKSFVHSFESNVFSGIGLPYLLGLCGCILVLFTVVYGLIALTARKLGFNYKDRIAALFCGTKKSLMHGTVFSKVLWSNSTAIGIILLPLMLFHAFQILIVGIIAGRYAETGGDTRK
ncbi:MAG: bile acid:sodium symporter [Leadbetterella sp.]|nr:bile acid:sodium symporter [Leadbetterella sp.]